MNIFSLNENQIDEWNSLTKQEHCFSLLQSGEWGIFKEKMGWKVYRIAVKDNGEIIAGAQLLIKPLVLGKSIAYIPRGPIGNWLTPEISQLLLSEICRIAHAEGAIFVKIEPPIYRNSEADRLLENCHFQRSRMMNQPQTTIILDLNQGQEDILRQMRKKTRQYIHRAEREGISVRFGTLNDLPAYYDLMRLTGKREHFAARSHQYYRTEWEIFSIDDHAALLLAYYQDQLVAVRTVYSYGQHAAEFHAGSLTIPGIHPNYLLVWEAIKWAKSKGCITYDLWGIPDEISSADKKEKQLIENRNDGLWGVYQFKRGFSRNIVSYIGAYDYAFIPGVCSLTNSTLFNGKWWEKLIDKFDSSK